MSIKILWWNVNKRTDINLKYFAPRLIFLIEIALGYDVIPEINGYRKLADPSIRMVSHGGVVAYVYNSLSTNAFDLIKRVSYHYALILIQSLFSSNPKIHRTSTRACLLTCVRLYLRQNNGV